jgi:ribokinase
MSELTTPRALIAGRLRRDYYITPGGQPRLDVPGGNLLFTTIGYLVWEHEQPPGMVARVGEDYPQEWLADFKRRGLDTRGIRVLAEAVELRSFFTYDEYMRYQADDPVAQFARLGIPFPRPLLGYRNPIPQLDSRTRFTPLSLRQNDIPAEYQGANAAHLAPIDYISHTLLPTLLRQAGFATITIDPSPGTMVPALWDDIPALLAGLTAFLPSEHEIRSLFQGRSADLWEMAAALAGYGCEQIVIKCGERGQILYNASSRERWEIPAYPARATDPTGVGAAFCGGFLAGYRRTLDPLQAVLYGNISASLVIEGSGAFFALDALPGLAQARLEALRQYVRKV